MYCLLCKREISDLGNDKAAKMFHAHAHASESGAYLELCSKRNEIIEEISRVNDFFTEECFGYKGT